MASRAIDRVLTGTPTMDGAGVRLTRIIGTPEQNYFDPFLLFDLFESEDPGDYIAGFPPHPHRGFETFTWLIAGRMRHEDSAGNGGVIECDGAQWMNAGRGIVHSEMPEQENGLLRGVQLWINRPASLKMSEPDYIDLDADNIIDEPRSDAVTVRVMAGRTESGTSGPVRNTPVRLLLLDVQLPPGATWSEPVDEQSNVMVWLADGAVSIGAQAGLLKPGQLALLGAGDRVTISSPDQSSRFLVAAGVPINEPVARGGPFVMNTKEEIAQAFADFEAGALSGAYYVPGRSKSAAE